MCSADGVDRGVGLCMLGGDVAAFKESQICHTYEWALSVGCVLPTCSQRGIMSFL